MALTLTQLVEDFADAAAALEGVSRSSSQRGLLSSIPYNEETGKHEPLSIVLRTPSGADVPVPLATLKHHRSYLPDKLRLSITTDAILKGRTLTIHAPQEFFPTKDTAGQPTAGNRRVGFFVTGGAQFGALATEDQIVASGVAHDLNGFAYYPNSGSVMLKCQAHTDFDLFAGMQVRIWNLDGEGETVLEIDRCERPPVTVGGFVMWHVQKEDLGWLVDVPDGDEFGLSFVDAAHNRMVEALLGKSTHRVGNSHFDIMVTFTDGLGESPSRLELTAEFSHHAPPEGVALVVDRLNTELRNALE